MAYGDDDLMLDKVHSVFDVVSEKQEQILLMPKQQTKSVLIDMGFTLD